MSAAAPAAQVSSMRSLRCDPETTPPPARSMAGCRTTPPAAIPPCASGSSLPIWAWPTGWPTATATAAGPPPEDLRQTARAGLIAAVDRYDPTHGTGFVPFAVASVVGELKRHRRDTSWRLHGPRRLKEQAIQACKTVEQLQQALGRSPTTSELAKRLQMAEEEVLEALAVARCRQELSLDRPVGDDIEVCLGDLLAAPAAREEAEDLLLLPRLVAALPEPDRTVIILRFFADLNQDEIATRVGFSQMQVSRLLRRALGLMRAQLTDP